LVKETPDNIACCKDYGAQNMKDEKFLGLDLSTQSLTAVVIDTVTGDLQQSSINFDQAYPSYGTTGGVLIGEDPTRVRVDPRMWVEALDDILGSLSCNGITRSISCMAASGQQHGTVYLNAEAQACFQSLDPSRSMINQLRGIFSRPLSPIWMDSSTHAECKDITNAMGGDSKVAELTGSIATERFSGPQIRKFWKEEPSGYERTRHIALVSSFVTSLLIGKIAPLDGGDGFGTNLADLATGKWSLEALEATAPDLSLRLPRIVRKDDLVGNVSDYLARRYSFSKGTEVVIGTGDNPSSLAGLGLIGEPAKKAISLGTSDTYFGYLPELLSGERTEGHIFGTADGAYMLLLCFKNGSLARQAIKNRYGLTWNEFSDILLKTAPGNSGRIMLPYFMPEITPLVLKPQVYRFGGLEEDDAIGNVRAVSEGQIMAMEHHSRVFGKKPDTILVTAGASENLGLLQTIADVFEAEAQSFEVKDSAALGAAIRAAKCCLQKRGNSPSWRTLTELFTTQRHSLVARPREEAVRVYRAEGGLLDLYAACEGFGIGKGRNPEKEIARFREIFS
jgi:xylulokinase